MSQKYTPGIQITIFFIATFFLVLYIKSPFSNDDYNQLCLAFAIFNYAWLSFIIIRYLYFYYNKGAKQFLGRIIPIPYGLKCFFGEPLCELGDVDIMSIVHFIGYFLIGFFIPGYYVEILIIGVACEFLELGMRYNVKFILDPAINLLGYTLGSKVSIYK